jgi:hypothetical protein
MLTHVVQHLGLYVATVECSWCTPFRSIPLKGCGQLGLKWHGQGAHDPDLTLVG